MINNVEIHKIKYESFGEAHKMINKSIGKNAIANCIKTLCGVIFPLITYPYVATILKVDNLGSYSFSYSVINYFYLLASLGITTYAIREGAKFRNSRRDFSQFASEIFTVNIVSTFISYLLLICILSFVPRLHTYSLTIAILSITMFFSLIGCEWIYSVYEEYMYIAIRTVFFQFISMIFLFMFVKQDSDVNVYAGIIVLAASGAQLINFIYLKKYCRLTPLFSRSVLKHLKPILVMFAGTLAISIYVSSDVTILGIMSGDYYVGLYSISTKIYTLLKQIMAGIIIVSIPRLSFYIGNNMNCEYIELCDKIVYSLTMILLPTIVGVVFLAPNIIIFISNETYLASSCSLVVLGLTLIVCLYNWFFTSCVLILNNKERAVLYATLIAAILNVGLNFIFIPLLNDVGAAITTFIAEASSLFMCVMYSRPIYKMKIDIWFLFSVSVGCIYVAIVCLVARRIMDSNIMVIAISMMMAIPGYYIIELLLKNTIAVQILNHRKEFW